MGRDEDVDRLQLFSKVPPKGNLPMGLEVAGEDELIG
jgi:hypothetical protein